MSLHARRSSQFTYLQLPIHAAATPPEAKRREQRGSAPQANMDTWLLRRIVAAVLAYVAGLSFLGQHDDLLARDMGGVSSATAGAYKLQFVRGNC